MVVRREEAHPMRRSWGIETWSPVWGTIWYQGNWSPSLGVLSLIIKESKSGLKQKLEDNVIRA